MVAVVVMVGHPLPGSVSTASPRLVTLSQSVSSILAGYGGKSLNQVNNSAIQLVLRQLLLVTQNTTTEYESLSFRVNPHCAADLLLEFFDSFVLVNIIKLVVLRVESLHCDCPHSYNSFYISKMLNYD